MLSINRTKSDHKKLTRYELDNIYYPNREGVLYEGEKKSYAIGFITPSKKQWLIGRRKNYIVLEIDEKNGKYRVMRRTNDLKRAEFSMNNAVTFEVMSKRFHELRKKTASDRASKKSSLRRKGARNDPVLKVIWSLDLKPQNQDTQSVWLAKRSLASVRPNDLEVVFYSNSVKQAV